MLSGLLIKIEKNSIALFKWSLLLLLATLNNVNLMIGVWNFVSSKGKVQTKSNHSTSIIDTDTDSDMELSRPD